MNANPTWCGAGAVRRATFVLALCAIGACSSSGRASPPPDPATAEVDARVQALLSGYEAVPTAADWARAGTPAEVAAALMRVAEKPEHRTLMAVRATSSLAFFPRPEVGAFLERRVADAKAPPALRGKAAIALAVAFGDTEAEHIAPLFASHDEDLREDAIRAFAHLASPAAERFLGQRLALEPSERLRTAIGDAKTRVALERDARVKQNRYAQALDALGPITDPGPVK